MSVPELHKLILLLKHTNLLFQQKVYLVMYMYAEVYTPCHSRCAKIGAWRCL